MHGYACMTSARDLHAGQALHPLLACIISVRTSPHVICAVASLRKHADCGMPSALVMTLKGFAPIAAHITAQHCMLLQHSDVALMGVYGLNYCNDMPTAHHGPCKHDVHAQHMHVHSTPQGPHGITLQVLCCLQLAAYSCTVMFSKNVSSMTDAAPSAAAACMAAASAHAACMPMLMISSGRRKRLMHALHTTFMP